MQQQPRKLVNPEALACPALIAAAAVADVETDEVTVVIVIDFDRLALMPGAIYYWREPTLSEIGWLALVAVFATAGHYAITRAIAAAPLTVTQPLSFLQLIWAIVFGYWLFDEVPDTWVIVGGLVIVAAVSYLAHREARAAQLNRLQTATTPVSPG
ncbi:MAG: DMT family transporter [Gammaproteobacteria bacterium]|nr:DMT family transporter [Gammaproteobacteria bacterium]